MVVILEAFYFQKASRIATENENLRAFWYRKAPFLFYFFYILIAIFKAFWYQKAPNFYFFINFDCNFYNFLVPKGSNLDFFLKISLQFLEPLGFIRRHFFAFKDLLCQVLESFGTKRLKNLAP